MPFTATIVQVIGATTAQLLAAGQDIGGAGTIPVRIVNITATGPVRLGGTEVNASSGLPWAVTEGPLNLNLGIGSDLYAAAAASCQLGVLRG